MNSNVLINVATEYDNRGFKQADKGIVALTKSVAKFAGTLALARRAQQSMFGFMEDEKATKVLARNLKNLGLAYATPSAEQFIATLQKQTGVLDDQLRPAYAQLVRVTGSTLETQKLMALAFDVSAGTGQDYENVINALSKAYVGNNRGLKTLNIGLTEAELKTKSFGEIVNILNNQFRGSGEASLDSYAGKMALLKVAAADAGEAIGKSLLDAITTASGPDGFPKFIKSIQTATNLVVDLVTGTSRLSALFDILASPSKGIGDMFKKYRSLRAQWDREDLQVQKERSGIANNTSSYLAKQAKDSILAAKTAKTQAKLAATQLATQKKLTAEKKAQAALDKANVALGAANNMFDIERISVAAAMANQTLTENERKRLEVKTAIFALEDAIDSKDTARIEKQTAILNGLTGQLSAMQKQEVALGLVKSALDALGVNKDLINLDNLDLALAKLKEMNLLLNGTKTPSQANNIYSPTLSADIYKKTAGLTFADVGAKPFTTPMTISGAASNIPSTFESVGAVPFTQPMSIASQTPVIVQITDNAQKLVDAVTFAAQNSSANGNPIGLYRNAQNLAW
jgi:hypothetical protein